MKPIAPIFALPGAAMALALSAAGAVYPTAAVAQQCTPGQFGECHFDKIIFRPTDGLKWDCPSDFMDPPDPLATNPNTGLVRLTDADRLDIKVPDDTRRVADIKQKVVEFLAERECLRANGARILKPHLTIIDVEYAILPRSDTPPPQGPDLVVRLLPPAGDVDCSGPAGNVVCTTTVRFRVFNVGDVDAGPFRVSISADQGITQAPGYAGLAAGLSFDDVVVLQPMNPPGNCYDPDCTERATVDSTNMVPESNEGNNTDMRTTPG